MAIALPGARGLFSPLQHALTRQQHGYIPLTMDVHDALHDFRAIANTLSQCPTSLFKIVPCLSKILGALDASGLGLGGVFFSDTTAYGFALPSDITATLVSATNPSGRFTINDFELLATYAQLACIASTLPVHHVTVQTSTNNTAALGWQTKGSVSATSPASRILRLQALHQRHHAYCSRFYHVPGAQNPMADDASCLWHLTDLLFLAHFNPSRWPFSAANWYVSSSQGQSFFCAHFKTTK